MATTTSRAGDLATPQLEARPVADRGLLRAFLERDRLYAAYAICDLDEREFGRTRWGGAFDGDRLAAIAMEYVGSSPQPLFVLGEPDGITAVLRSVVRPRAAYIAALTAELPAVERVYRLGAGPPMVRMWVDRPSFRPAPGSVARLLPSEIGDLNRLYNLGFTAWLPSEAIVSGVYFGIRIGGRLVATAGTHVVSHDARLAVVGNVMTHPDFRNRGLAKQVTSAVTQELLRTCDQVVLNVRSDNPPALAAYAALGYREHLRFEERLGHRRSSTWDSIVAPLRRFFPPRKES
jgi:ribosomal protein S18 acetylase RimI-like enzyme